MISRIFRSIVTVAAASALVSIAAAPQLHAQVNSSLVTNRLTQPVDENSRVTLRGTVSPMANAANDRGAAPDSMPLDHIQVVLARSAAQEAALKQLIQQQHTPGSPSYHKWLTPTQFGEQFGPSDQDVATLEAWFQSQGFNVQKVNAGKQTMVISGNVAQFRNAFHAQIHKYMVNGETHYANATNPQIPAALAPVFGGFSSLNNFRPHSYAHVLGHATYNPKTGRATPQWTYGNSQGESFVVAPGDFAKQYDVPNGLNGAGTLDGSGQTIAIVNESNIDVSLVNSFRTLFSLPANPPQVILAGNDPGIDGVNEPDGLNYASGEAYLDVEWAGAVAPRATVDLVIAGDTALESGVVLAAEDVIYNNLAPVMSLSFGMCEQNLGSSNAFINDLYEQAAAEGITVVVASGDSGSAGCDNDNTEQYAVSGLAVSGYASTPYNVAVGGTDFFYSDYNQSSSILNNQLGTYWNLSPSQNPSTSLLQTIPEQPWNDSQYGLNAVNFYTATGQTSIAGGGGGASSCATGTVNTTNGSFSACTAGYAKPAWQTGTGVPADKVRDIPDVSLFAAAGLNYSYYPTCAADGDCQPASGSNLIQITGVGGTSASAPSFAGIMALVNEKYGRQGQADTVLYAMATQYPAAFHDVTNGTNTEPCAFSTTASSNTPNCISAGANAITITASGSSVLEGELGTGTTADYNATAGYDLATGLGSVDAATMINDWGNVKFATSTVALTSPTAGASFTHGQSVTFTGTVTGTTPTGNVAIETSSAESGQAGQGLPALLSGSPSVLTLNGSGAFSGAISTLPGGTYNVWASYGGDAKNAAGQSTPFQITVAPEASGIAFNLLTPNNNGSGYGVMASGTNNIPYGSQILLSAVVAPSGQVSAYQSCLTGASKTCPQFTIPTGSVTFADGSTNYSALINAEGEAEYNSPTTFSVGAHSITANYSGDNSYNASTASAQTFTIVKATPTIFITGATNQQGQIVVQQGQNLTLTLLVEGYGTGIAPTGTLTISGGPTGTPTSATLSPTVDPFYGTTAGTATLTINTTAPTTAALAPQYRKGLPGWLAGGGAVFACVLLFGIPARRKSWRGIMGLLVITLFTLSVSIGCGSSGGSGSGGGSGGGGGGGNGGGGTTIGAYTINVSYAGDGNYNSASGSTSISVAAASTLVTSTTQVTSTSSSPTTAAAVGVTVTVNGVTGHAAPTGTVVLYTGSLSPNSSSQGTAVEITQGTLTAGSGTSSTASFSFNSESLLQGANLLTVLYEGDTTYASSSTTLNLSNPLSDFSLTPSNSTVSVASAGTGTDTLTLTSNNGFTGTVNVACATPTGTLITCSLSAPSVSLNGTGNTATSTLTINGNRAAPGNYQVQITGSAGTSPIHTLAVTAAVR